MMGGRKGAGLGWAVPRQAVERAVVQAARRGKGERYWWAGKLGFRPEESLNFPKPFSIFSFNSISNSNVLYSFFAIQMFSNQI
jgi:hypothetical protein